MLFSIGVTQASRREIDSRPAKILDLDNWFARGAIGKAPIDVERFNSFGGESNCPAYFLAHCNGRICIPLRVMDREEIMDKVVAGSMLIVSAYIATAVAMIVLPRLAVLIIAP